MTGADLIELSTAVLAQVGASTAIEVQAIHVDGQVAITANNPAALRQLFHTGKDANALLGKIKGVTPELHRRLVAPDAVAGARLGTIKLASDEQKCADSLAIHDRALILLHGNDSGPAMHAEQRLLLALAIMLKDKKPVDTVHVWGAKPPCDSCKAVLTAFSQAMNAVYDKSIIYSGVKGQPRDVVGRMHLAEVFTGGLEETFARFVAIYESNLAKLA